MLLSHTPGPQVDDDGIPIRSIEHGTHDTHKHIPLPSGYNQTQLAGKYPLSPSYFNDFPIQTSIYKVFSHIL